MSDLMKQIKEMVDNSNSARISIKKLKNGDIAVEHTEKIRLAQTEDHAKHLGRDDRIILKVEFGNIVSIEKIHKRALSTVKMGDGVTPAAIEPDAEGTDRR